MDYSKPSSWGSYFRQTANIDASSTSNWNSSSGFTATIGNGTTKFTGNYDGQNYTIDNLYISSSSTVIGLFDESNGATISNLGLTNVNITARPKTGALIGWDNGSSTISNCYSTGSVSGTNFIGGLIGQSSSGIVNKSYSACSVTGSGNYIGGLEGAQNLYSCQINNSYAIGNVTCGTNVGGLLGRGSAGGGTITNSYATGKVTGSNTGGLIGNTAITVNNSFWDTETTGQSSSAGGTGESTSNMKSSSTFTGAGWDFGSTWAINSGINNGYPYLQNVTILSVELTTLTANILEDNVNLNWKTSTEVNNYGFEVQRLAQNSNSSPDQAESWEKIGFVKGNGTSNNVNKYSFVDKTASRTALKYRLKQIDIDGSFKYSKIVAVSLIKPDKFELNQNYPNPFNPTTKIKYSIPKTSNVELKVFDILGRKVAELVNEEKPAGNYTVDFNASKLSSGIYFYRITSGNFTQVKKMILLK